MALGPLTRLRFVPNANYNGAVSVEFVAWDQTGSSGAVSPGDANVDARYLSNSGSFSNSSAVARLVVLSVNDFCTQESLASKTYNQANCARDRPMRRLV